MGPPTFYPPHYFITTCNKLFITFHIKKTNTNTGANTNTNTNMQVKQILGPPTFYPRHYLITTCNKLFNIVHFYKTNTKKIWIEILTYKHIQICKLKKYWVRPPFTHRTISSQPATSYSASFIIMVISLVLLVMMNINILMFKEISSNRGEGLSSSKKWWCHAIDIVILTTMDRFLGWQKSWCPDITDHHPSGKRVSPPPSCYCQIEPKVILCVHSSTCFGSICTVGQNAWFTPLG